MKTQILAELYALLKNPPTVEIWERFCSNIDPISWTHCWEWKGYKKRGAFPYGVLNVNRRPQHVHRLIWVWLTPSANLAKATDHRWCDNPPCCNPLHTIPTTRRANNLRGTSKSAVNKLKTHCPNGHPLIAGNLVPYSLKIGQRKCLECTRKRLREFQVTKRRGNPDYQKQQRDRWASKQISRTIDA